MALWHSPLQSAERDIAAGRNRKALNCLWRATRSAIVREDREPMKRVLELSLQLQTTSDPRLVADAKVLSAYCSTCLDSTSLGSSSALSRLLNRPDAGPQPTR
jgi:hypothetical protein